MKRNSLFPLLHVGQEALWSLGLKVTYAGLTFLATILLVRLLGAAAYGVFAYIFALITVLSIPAQFGLPPLVLRETAKGIARKDAALVKGIWVWAGWFVAEYGRQPWTIGEVLPTFISTSALTTGDLIGSIIGFVLLYTVLLIAELYLMIKFARLGPSSLHTGRYHFEQDATAETTA